MQGANLVTGEKWNAAPAAPVQLAAAANEADVIKSTFVVIPNEGKGDCAFIAIGQALADSRNEDLHSESLKAGGRVQQTLRLKAGAEVLNNPDKYVICDGTHQSFTKALMVPGSYANGTSLLALAQYLDTELRIWTFGNVAATGQPERLQYTLYAIRPVAASRKKKNEPKMLIWMHLKDQHYEFLKPVKELPSHWDSLAIPWTPETVLASQTATEETASATKKARTEGHEDVAVDDGDVDLTGTDPLVGGGRSVASTAPTASLIRRWLGNQSASARNPTTAPSRTGSVRAKAKTQLTSRTAAVDKSLNNEADGDMPREHRSHLHCPCGWRPTQGAAENSAITEARRHWHICQGCRPPRASVGQAQLSALRRRVGLALGPSIAEAGRKRALRDHKAWIANAPQKVTKVLCSPELEVVFLRGTLSEFVCTRCSRQTGLAEFRKTPCRRSAEDGAAPITKRAFGRLVHGESRAVAVRYKTKVDRDRARRHASSPLLKEARRLRDTYVSRCKRQGVRFIDIQVWRELFRAGKAPR